MAPFSWSRWLRSLVRRPARPYRRARHPRPLLLEALETRLAPATFVWSGMGKDNHWSTGTNWFGGVAPSGNLDDLVFPALPGQTGNITTTDDIAGSGAGDATFNSISIASSYTLTGNVGLTLANPTGSGSVIVGAGASGVVISIPLTLAAVGNGQFFTVNNGADLTLNKSLSGPSGSELAKDGAGLLVLNEDGSGFEGSVVLVDNGGIAQIGRADALGDPLSGLTTTVGTNAQLQVNNLPANKNTVFENLVLNGSGVQTDGALLNVAGTNTWSGSVTLDSDVAFGSTAGELVINGGVSDLGAGHSVTKEGPGIVTFATANSYRGTTTVNNGILRVQNAGALGAGDGTPTTAAVVNESVSTAGAVLKAGTLQLDDPAGTGFTIGNHLLTLNGFGAGSIGALSNNRGPNTWSGNVTFGTPLPSVFDVYVGAEIAGANNALTVSGTINQVGGYTFSKVRPGTVILTNVNTYTGTTVVVAGILEITESNALGNTPLVNVLNNATLELSVAGKTGDSVTGLANELRVSKPLQITGPGAGNVGALFSQSGINTYTGRVTLAGGGGAIGVAPDPNETNGPGYFTNDYSLTVPGSIVGNRFQTLTKVGNGQLILPNGNFQLTSQVNIAKGWVTVENNASLGVPVAGLGDTRQPTVTVQAGGALHLDPQSGGNLVIPQNLNLSGTGVDHVFGLIDQQGAVENVAGANLMTGNVVFNMAVGLGVENVFGVLPSQLILTGSMSEGKAGSGIIKLGSQRLVLQGDGTYTGPVDVRAGVLLTQNATALGAGFGANSTVTVEDGASLELGSTVGANGFGLPPNNGGLASGFAVWGEHLILNGTGDPDFGDAALTVLSPGDPQGPVLDALTDADYMWRGPVSIKNSAVIQVATDQRLTVYGVIDGPVDADVTLTGGGGLNLAGANTYVGVTTVSQGVLTVQNGLALGGAPVAAVQTLSITGAKVNTTQFTLTFGGSTTPTLTYNGNDAPAIQAALQALPSVSGQGGQITVTGAGGNYSITFGGYLTGFHQPKLAATLVTGPGNLDAELSQDGSGGVIVAGGASLQLQGGITVANKPVIVQGQGLGTVANPVPQWFNIGPAPELKGQTAGNGNVSGRVTGVAVDPTDPNVIYIATAGGGAWKTLNGGKTWLQLFDASYAMYGGAIAVAPSDPHVIYYGTGEADNSGDSFAGTGLYRSGDSGRTWTLVTGTPPQPVNPMNGLSISKIAIDPSNPNMVFVATSDLQVNGYYQQTLVLPPDPNVRVGVWRYDGNVWFDLTGLPSSERNPATSTHQQPPPDGHPGPDDDFRLDFPQANATWSDLALVGSSARNNLILYAALGTDIDPTTGAPSPANAVYRCEFPVNATGTFEDVFSNQVVWYIGSQGTDSRSSTEFPSNLTSGGIEGNIKIAVFSSDPNGLYLPPPTNLPYAGITIIASIARPDNVANPGALNQIIISTNGGVSWTAPQNQPANYLGDQGNYDSAIYTPDGVQVYVGGQEADPVTHAQHVLYSPDSGATASWTDISVDAAGNGPHTDEHALVADSQGRILDGNDGGVWRYDPATQTWTDLNGNLATNTVNSVAVDPNNPGVAYEGSQDNGVAGFNDTGAPGVDPRGWSFMDTGDGGLVRVDPLNPNTVYHVVNGFLVKSTAGPASTPASWTQVLQVPGTQYFPFLIDQVNSRRLLAGGVQAGTRLQETTDGGASWHDLGSPIAVTSLAVATYQGTFQRDQGFPLVTDQGTSTYDPNTIYVSDGSSVWVTKDHGASWVDRTSNLTTIAPLLLSGGMIANITVDPANRDTAYIVSNGPPGESLGRIFKTDDAGQTWTDFTHNLPDVPVYTFVVDPRTQALYVGTDQGVYVSTDGGGTWDRFGAGLPFVQVDDLALNQLLNTLTAASYGRGVFQMFLPDVQPRANAGALNAVSGANVWSGPVLLGGDTSLGAEGTQALQNGIATASLNVVGSIVDQTAGGNSRLTKVGPGNVIFSGTNTYGGMTEVAEGRLVVRNPQALGASGSAASGTVVDTGINTGAALQLQSNIDGEWLTLNGKGPSPGLNGHDTGALENVSGNNTYSGPIALASGVTIGVDTNSTLTITGSIGDNGGNFSLAKELTGTLVLAAANSYGGNTAVNQGAVNVQNGQGLGAAGTLTTVLDGAQLQLQGGITVSGERLRISGTGIVGTGALVSVGGANHWAGPITLAKDPGLNPNTTPPNSVAVGSVLNSPGDVLFLDGNIGQDNNTLMGLTKVGPGILTLTSANTYDGVTTVAAGALRLQSGSALGTVVNGTVVQNGAALELDGDPGSTGGSIEVSGETLTLNGSGTPEVQQLNVGGAAGSFTLNFKGQTTTALAFNATAAQVASALNALSTVGGVGGSVSVASGTPGIFLITFGGTLAGSHQPLLVANTSGGATATVTLFRDGGAGALHAISGNDGWAAPVILAGTNGTPTTDSIGVDPGLTLTVSGPVQDPAPVTVPAAGFAKVGAGTLVLPSPNSYTGLTFVNQGVLNVQAGTQLVGSTTESGLGAAVNEVQTVAVGGALTGSFTLTFTFNGKTGTTPVLPANVPASGGVGPTGSLQNALNSLASIGGVGGSVSVTKSGSTYTIVFGGSLANTNVSQLTGAGLSGAVLTIRTVQDGSEPTVVANGATLQLQGGATMSSEGLTLNGNGFGGIGALDSTAGNNAWTTPITLASNTSIGSDGASVLTLSGVLGQLPGTTTTLTKVGTGTAVLTGSASNAYTGLTTVAGGQLDLAKTGGALAVIGDLTVGNGTSAPGSEVAQLELPNQIAAAHTVNVLADGVFDLNGQQQALAALNMTGGSVLTGGPAGRLTPGAVTASADAAGNPATMSGAGALNLGGSPLTITVNGPGFASPAVADMVIAAPIIGGAGASLTKSGAGVLQLTNNESYPGATTVAQGALLADAGGGNTVGDVILAGGTIGGTGQVANITPSSAALGGTVKPGDGTGLPGNLTTTPAGGSETWNAQTTLFLTLLDKAPGDFATLSVNGNIDLGGASLAGFVGPGLKIGDSYTILTTSGGTISGKFNEPFTPGAVYVGGQKFTITYTSTTVTLTAVQQVATVDLSSSANPSVYGQHAIFTATMTPEPGSGSVPDTDTVTFSLDGGPVKFTTNISNNQATFDPVAYFGQALSVGTHKIDATFNGDSKFAPALAPEFTQTVNKASTSLSLSNDPTNPIPNQTIHVTATLSPVAPGAGVPSGTATFTLDGGSPTPEALNAAGEAVFPFMVPIPGTHHIRVTYSGDANFKPVSSTSDYNVTVAKGTPTITITAVPLTSVYSQSVIFAAVVSGPIVPTGSVSFYRDTVVAANNLGTVTLDASGSASVTTSVLPAGTHQIIVTYSGNPSYLNTQDSVSYTVLKEQTDTSLSASDSVIAFGAALKLTATLSPEAPATATPTGQVTFLDGTTVLGVANVTAAGVATFATTGLGVGAHTITASYGGTSNFGASTSNSVSVLVQVGTLVTVSTSANPAFYGQALTITAKLRALPPGNGIPAAGETVNFYDGLPGGTLLAADVPIDATGAASIVTGSGGVPVLGVGTHTLSVTFGGDSTFLPGTGTASQSVIRSNTTTTVTSSVTPSVFGQAVTFTASVAAKAPGAGLPGGSVKFYDGAVLPAHLLFTSGPLGGGTVTFTTASLGAMPHTIIAVYQGDTNFVTSQGSVSQVVNKDGTTTTINGPSTSVFGQMLTYTAVVGANAPGGGVPSGRVSFFDTVGTTTKLLGTANLSGAQALFSINSLGAGAHSISASYTGDNNFAASQTAAGGSAPLTVSRDGTTSAVTSSRNPSIVGQAVTYTARVTANAPGSGIPTGTVTFFDGPLPLGSAKTLTSGKATFVTGPLAYGVHDITAVYHGDPNYLDSASPGSVVLHLSQSVLYPDTVSVTASPGTTAVFGQTLTFNVAVAPVTGNAPAGKVPGGQVDIFDNGKDLSGLLDLDPATGTVSFPTGALPVGKHNITVSYGGDSFFITNITAKALVVTVNKDGTTVAVSDDTPTHDHSSVYGLTVTLSAAVSANGPGSGTPTGSVTFWDGAVNTGKKLGTVGLDGTGQANLAVSTLGAGTHTIRVSYAGDGNFTGSNGTDPSPVVVAQATTQTTVSGPSSDAVFGQLVSFVATVNLTSGGGTPVGSVSFFDQSVVPAKLLGSAPLSGGTATFSIGTLAVGDHSIQAVYPGTSNYAGSSTDIANGDNADLTVDQDGTAVQLSSSANPSGVLQPVTFTARVVPNAPGAGTATGTVTFMDGAAVLGTVKLVGGTATLTTSTLGVGSHDITASYGGDTNFTGNTSDHLTQVVNTQTVTKLTASVSRPGGVGVNTAFAITVIALDSSNSRVFADFDPVTVTLVSAPAKGQLLGPNGKPVASLSGSFTNGMAVFSGLKVTVGGTYKVKAKSNGIEFTLTFSTGGRQN